jgi:hypothetical protein
LLNAYLQLVIPSPLREKGQGKGEIRERKNVALPVKSLSLNKLLPLNPPLEKGDKGGFALARFGEIPPSPLYKGGNIISGQALMPSGENGSDFRNDELI